MSPVYEAAMEVSGSIDLLTKEVAKHSRDVDAQLAGIYEVLKEINSSMGQIVERMR